MSKFTPIHEEAISYTNRNDYEKTLHAVYPMCMSRSSVMTEMRVVGSHLVAEWNHLTHTGKIYVLDELSNAKLGNYHQTLAGKKKRMSGEGESLVKPQAVPATDGKAQELSEAKAFTVTCALPPRGGKTAVDAAAKANNGAFYRMAEDFPMFKFSSEREAEAFTAAIKRGGGDCDPVYPLNESQEPRRFIAWGKDVSKAISVVSRDEEAVRSYAADHFKISSFGVNVLDAALKTQMGQYGVPKELWSKAKGDVILDESNAQKIAEAKFYLATKSGQRITTNPKVFYSKAEAERHAEVHSNLPLLDGAVVMQESAADALLTALAESKSAKSLDTSGLQAVLKDAGVPATVVDSAYAGCDADICHYFAVVESGDLFGVIGIRLMAMDGDISVLSFDTDAASVSEDKASASEAMTAATKKPLVESERRADAELLESLAEEVFSESTSQLVGKNVTGWFIVSGDKPPFTSQTYNTKNESFKSEAEAEAFLAAHRSKFPANSKVILGTSNVYGFVQPGKNSMPLHFTFKGTKDDFVADVKKVYPNAEFKSEDLPRKRKAVIALHNKVVVGRVEGGSSGILSGAWLDNRAVVSEAMTAATKKPLVESERRADAELLESIGVVSDEALNEATQWDKVQGWLDAEAKAGKTYDPSIRGSRAEFIRGLAAAGITSSEMSAAEHWKKYVAKGGAASPKVPSPPAKIDSDFEWRLRRGHDGHKELVLFKKGEYAATFVYKVGEAHQYSSGNVGKWEFSSTGITGKNSDGSELHFGTTKKAYGKIEDLDKDITLKGLPSVLSFKKDLEDDESIVVTAHSWTDYKKAVPEKLMADARQKAADLQGFYKLVLALVAGRNFDHTLSPASKKDLAKYYESE